MNLHDLEAFVAVVETGSIVGASVRLNLTQPGVTRRVQTSGCPGFGRLESFPSASS